MPDAGHDPTRLNDLKLRWKQDPGSRLFLQLAEEHRKLGQHAEAASVLEEGLEKRPDDLSALVALGRCRLELEQHEEAVSPLEAVVSRDPTHIVANKLLLEAHLRRGDAEKAEERLEIYKILNDRDPELDHLEYRLKRLHSDEDEQPTVAGEDAFELEEEAAPEQPFEIEASPAEDEGPPPPEEPFEIEDLEPPAEPEAVPAVEAAGDPFDLSADAPAAAGGLADLWEAPPPAKAAPRPPADPFEDLALPDEAQHWEQLAQEGIFALPDAPAPAAGSPEAGEAAVEEVGEVVETPEAAPDEETRETAGEAAEAEEAEPTVEEAVEAAPVEKPAEAAPTEEPLAEETPVAEEPSAAEVSEPPATVPLGELYLKQGHTEEAKKIFRAVLERDPHNRAALGALERLESSRQEPLTAAALLAVRGERDKIPEGLTAKKVLVLANYVKRLRQAERDHVR